MKKTEIIEKINQLLSDEFEINISEINPDASLIETLNLDSLDIVDVVVLIDLNFSILLKGSDFIDVKTFNDFYNLIITKLDEPKE